MSTQHIPPSKIDTTIPKSVVQMIALGVTIAILTAAYVLCSTYYATERQKLLAEQERLLSAWVSSTSKAISLWNTELESQARRISTSELYRQFAADVGQLDSRATTQINELENPKGLPKDISILVEQIPLLRNVLMDFMNFNGMTDVRIVNKEGVTILSAMVRPNAVTPEQHDIIKKALEQRSITFAAVRGTSAGLVLDFAAPLHADLTPQQSKQELGALLLSVPVTAQISRFLSRDIPNESGLKAYLVQKHRNTWENLQVQPAMPIPLQQDAPFTQSEIPFAERIALTGTENVFSIGTQIPEQNWWLVLEKPASEILSQMRYRAYTIYGIGFLIALGILLIMGLIWRSLVSRQQKQLATHFETLYRLTQQQKRLLDGVNASLDVGLVMYNLNGEIQICNPAFGKIVGKSPEETEKETLVSLFDSTITTTLLQGIRNVTQSQKGETIEISLLKGTDIHLYRVTLFPATDVETSSEENKSAVAIFQDITQFRLRSQQQQQQQHNTITALIRAIESVDPYLTGHSSLMQEFADQVCRQMALDPKDRQTLEIATSLSQIGRLFVPRELLAKTEKLSEEEQKELMRIPEHAFSVLRYVDFGLPVTESIYTMYENIDGSGYPRGLKADEIGIHARVLAVLNAFCAMISPRSYRTAMPVEKALNILRSKDAIYDQSIVEMLASVVYSAEGKQIMTYRGTNITQPQVD